MACYIFNPNLPTSSDLEQIAWVAQWNANLLNSNCLQTSCAMVCLQGNSITSDACMSCLHNHGCDVTENCLQCVDGEVNNFSHLYACTISESWPIWEVIIVVICCLAGYLMLWFICIFIAYRLKILPSADLTYLDHWFARTNVKGYT